MTIIRDNKEITLTPEELRKAFYEQQNNFYIEDMESRYEIPDDIKDRIVEEFDDCLESNDCYMDSYWETLDYICRRTYNLKEIEE